MQICSTQNLEKSSINKNRNETITNLDKRNRKQSITTITTPLLKKTLIKNLNTNKRRSCDMKKKLQKGNIINRT